MTMIQDRKVPELDNLTWAEPKPISIGGRPKLLRTAEPNEQFWNLWRQHKEECKEAGVTISKFQGVWAVNWWQQSDGEFHYPVLPELIVDDAGPLEVEPLVNESNLLSYQIALVQQTVASMKQGWKAALNGCGTGVGKTYITLGAIRESGRRAVIVCPKNITSDWTRAAHFMKTELAGVFGWEWIKTGKTPFGYWEMSKPKGKGKAKKEKFVWTLPDGVDLVFDEAHRASGIDTQNSHIVCQAKDQGARIYMLSATIANDPTKMKAVGYVLNLHRNGRDFYNWMARHGVVEQDMRAGGRSFKIYKFQGSARHLQSIHASIFPSRGCRVTAEELGDKFPKTQIIAKSYDLDESREINAAYREMEARVDELMSLSMSASERQANILVEILRARQRVELLKVPLFISLTRDALEEGMRPFIAVNFKETAKQLAEALDITAVISGIGNTGKYITGNRYTEHDRQNAIDDFQANRVDRIIGIIKACREGLNLHDLHGGAPRIGFFMPTPSAFDLKQLLGRLHRAGGKTPSIQRIVFAADTIEEQVCENLATKLDQLDLLMDGDLQKGIFPASYSSMRPDTEEEDT